MVEFLESKGQVDTCDVAHMQSDLRAREKYTYIVGMDIIEVSRQPIELLKLCRDCLNPDGHLLLGTENRYAIKYICGDRDPYTNHSFDGGENNRRLTEADWDVVGGRCYSMVEEWFDHGIFPLHADDKFNKVKKGDQQNVEVTKTFTLMMQ